MSVLTIDVRPGERLAFSGEATVEFVQKSGRFARLKITAPSDVRIEKTECDAGQIMRNVAPQNKQRQV